MYEEKMRVPPPPPGIHITVNYMIFWYYWHMLKFGWNLYLRIINALCTLAAMGLARLAGSPKASLLYNAMRTEIFMIYDQTKH